MRPHHLAAAQYTVLAVFLWASWLLLLSPPERAIGQLQFIFAPSYEHRTFFIFYALSAVTTTALAIVFWFSRSCLKPFATWLAAFSAIFFAVAIWFFDSSLILGFGLGCVFALWSYFAPNQSFKRDRLKSPLIQTLGPLKMNIAQRLLKEFWLPTLVAITWTIYNLSTQTSAWNVKSLVNVFGPTFFLASWATGQFFRVKKQANLDSNLLSIEGRVSAVVERLEQHTKDFLGYTTGGDSIGYFIVGIATPETLELVFHNPSQYPVFDIYSEAIDLDEPIDPKANKWWTRHPFALEKIYPNKASGSYRFPLGGRNQLRLNVFIHTRTQGVIQQIRILRKDNWFQIAEMVRSGETVVKLEVPDGFPGYDPANPNTLFN